MYRLLYIDQPQMSTNLYEIFYALLKFNSTVYFSTNQNAELDFV